MPKAARLGMMKKACCRKQGKQEAVETGLVVAVVISWFWHRAASDAASTKPRRPTSST